MRRTSPSNVDNMVPGTLSATSCLCESFKGKGFGRLLDRGAALILDVCELKGATISFARDRKYLNVKRRRPIQLVGNLRIIVVTVQNSQVEPRVFCLHMGL